MISVKVVQKIHKRLIDDFGGIDGIRDLGLMESALARPFAIFDGIDLYPYPIDKAAALAHASKIEDETTKTFILDIIEQVYAFPLAEINADPDASRKQFKQKTIEKCLVTRHDKMPDYKPF